MPEQILVFADAEPEDGRGHLCRTARVAAALRDATGGSAGYFVSKRTTAAAELRAQGFAVELLPEQNIPDALGARAAGGAAVIVDSYRVPVAAVTALSALPGVTLLAFADDGRLADCGAPLLLNAAPGSAGLYPPAMAADGLPTEALTGLCWLPLSPELAAAHGTRRGAGNLLVTLGGADPEQVTRRVCRAAARANLPLTVQVVLGADYPAPAALAEEYAGDRRFVFHRGLTDLTPLLRTADLVVTACGMTLWEICFMQVPVLAVQTADNQVLHAAAARRHGIAMPMVLSFTEEELALRLQAAFADAAGQTASMAAQAELFAGWRGAVGVAERFVRRRRMRELRRQHPRRAVSVRQVGEEYRASAAAAHDWQRLRWGSEEGMRNRYRRVSECLPGAKTVADIGCGTGGLLAEIPAACYRGIDASLPLLRHGVAAHGPRFAAARAGLLPLRDASVDAVVLCGILQNCGEAPGVLLRESARILKVGGRLVLLAKNLGWRALLLGEFVPDKDIDWFFAEEIEMMLHDCGLQVALCTGFLPREGRDVALPDSHEMLIVAVR